MKKSSLFLFVNYILLGFYLISCAPSKPVMEERILSADRLIKKLEANRRKIKTFRGTGIITVNSADLNAKSSFEVLIKKPDSLKISFYGPFGIDLAQAVITTKDFRFYDIINNTLYQGNVKSGVIKQILKIDLPLDQVVDALAGSVNLTDKLRIEPTSIEYLDDFYKLNYIDSVSMMEQIYLVRSDDLAVSENLIRANGKGLLEGKYSRFNLFEEVPIPYEINIENTSNKERLKLEYRNVEVNKNDFNFNLDLPDDVKIIEW
ncbi:MAG: DUF4292 domain-containing protein [Bacteroidota bacterium]